MSKQKKRRNKSTKNKSNPKLADNASAADQPAGSSDAPAVASPRPSKSKGKKTRPVAGKQSKTDSTSIMSRRNAIRLLIALPVAGVAGAAIHRYDVQNRGLHDLTLIGQGAPVVVQIHDPACQLCRRLMNNTRKALKDHDDVVFRVADITTGDGGKFQRKHNAETVSLLLFNAKGDRVGTVTGVTPVDELKSRFGNLN